MVAGLSSFLINALFAVLCVLPGIIVVSEVFKWRISDVRSIIFGILFWNFVFVSLSVFVGCVSTFLNGFFYVFTGLSVAVIVFWVVKSLIRRPSFVLSWRLHELPLIVLIAVLLFYVALVMAFHPIYMEYDALYAYLPYAQGISEAGGFHPNSYMVADVGLARMPLMPLYYAWGLTVFGADSFRLIPFISVVLSVFAVYQTSRMLFPERRVVAFLAPAVFLSLPAVLSCISIYSLYVDLPLMAFTVSAVCCSALALKHKQLRYYLFAGAAVTLAVFSKEGGYIALLLSICILSLQFTRKIRVLAFAVATSPFYFLIVKNALTLDPSSSLYMISVVYKQSPVIIMLVFLAVFMFLAPKNVEAFNRGSLKKLVYLLSPLSALAFFMVRNYLYFGSAVIYGNFVTNTMSFSGQLDALWFLRFDLLFTVTGLGSIYLVLIVVALACVAVKFWGRNSIIAAVLGVWLVLLVLDWAYFYNFQYTISEIRRLLLLCPFIATAVAYGFSCMYDRLTRKKPSETEGFLFAFITAFVFLCCIVVFQLQFMNLSGTYLTYVGVPEVSELLTPTALAAGLLVCGCIFGVVYLRSKVRVESSGLKLSHLLSSKRRKRLVSAAALVGVAVVCFIPLNVGQMVLDVNGSGWDIVEYQNRTEVAYFVDYLPEIIDYYSHNLDGSYVTVTYGRQPTALMYFIDYKVVDLRQGVGKYDFLRSNDTDTLFFGLSGSDVKYFLVPLSKATWYDAYLENKDRFLLFGLIDEGRYFESVKNFTCYELYRFVEP